MSAKNSSRFLAVLVLGTAGLFVIHHHRPAPRSADMGAEIQSTPPAARADFTKLSRLTGGDPANPPATTFPAAALPENIQMNTEPDAAPAWAVRYGAEFWRKPAGNRTAKASPADLALAATINLGDVIERVTHAAEVDPETGLPSVRAGTYSASFDGTGVRFSPHRLPAPAETRKLRVAPTPEPDPGTEAVFRTVAISRDGQPLYAAGGAHAEWAMLGNTAQALLDPASGLVEHYEARADGVEVTWVVPRALPGAGPLVVEAELSGLSYAGPSAAGHHFADASGTPRVRVGLVTVMDAAGHSEEVAMRAEGGRLRVEVPAAVLANATYPLAIDPVLGAEFSVNTSAAASYDWEPAIAFNGVNFLVVWTDQRNVGSAGNDIYGTRLSPAGVVLNPEGIPISVAPRSQQYPTVAAKGTDFLVAWEDHRNDTITKADIYATTVSGAGSVIHLNGVVIDDGDLDQTLPVLAANSTGFLVVYEHHYSTDSDVIGRRLRFAGDTIEKEYVALPWSFQDELAPALAACGDKFLVVWSTTKNTATGSDIAGALVPGYGMGPAGGELAICRSPGGQYTPAVAANATEYLVVWQDLRNSSTGADIYGARVSKDGLLITSADGNADGDFPICVWPASQVAPAVGCMGNDFLVVWQDYRNASSDICGTRVSGAGAVMDGSMMKINDGPQYAYSPALAFAPGGKAMVVSQTYRDGVYRTVGNLVQPNAAAGTLRFSAASYTVGEGVAHAVITVQRVNGSAGTVKVNYTTQNGSATSPSDYTARAGTLTFLPGVTSATFAVPIVNDALDETNETVTLKLSNPTGGATLGAQSYAKLIIADNDAGGVIQFALANYNAAENATTILLNVTRTGGTAGGVTVGYKTTELTGPMHASAGLDYTAVTSSLTFDAGQTLKQMQITLKPDALPDGLEKFKVELMNPTGGATLGPRRATLISIIDDDGP